MRRSPPEAKSHKKSQLLGIPDFAPVSESLEDCMSLKKWSLELPRIAFFISASAKALSLSHFLRWDI